MVRGILVVVVGIGIGIVVMDLAVIVVLNVCVVGAHSPNGFTLK